MTERQKNQNAIAEYVETFLEEHFGEKPEQIDITLRSPFLLIHMAGFLLPAEELLLEKGREKQVLETRDILMQSVKEELLKGLEAQINQQIDGLYADWNMSKQSGLLIVTLKKQGEKADDFSWPQGVNQEILREIIILNSIRTQKKPDQTNFYWLNDQVLLIERLGVLIDIEKKLVENGVAEELRLAKRPMEYRIIELFNLQSILNSQVQDLFVDWNFQHDVSYMVLILNKDKSQELKS